METLDPPESVIAPVAETEIIDQPQVAEGGLPPRMLFEMESELRKVKIDRELGRIAGI